MKRKKKKTKNKRWIIAGAIAVFFIMILILILLIFSYTPKIGYGNVAVIEISGEIGAKGIFGAGVDPDEIIKLIEQAEKNNRIDAMLIEINSPGGSAVGSEEIARAVKESTKLSIALIRDVGASGAYWVASAADIVIASPASLTGSIGVTASYLEFTGLLEKYGVSYEELKAGEYKDIGSPFRTLTKEEREMFQKRLDELHEYFVNSVSKNRNLDEDQTKQISTAMFYLGSEAKQLNLVDVLGGKKEAEEIIKTRLGVKRVNFVEYRRAKGFFELFGGLLAGQSIDLIKKESTTPVIEAR